MIILLSPAKKQSFVPLDLEHKTTLPQCRKEALELITQLKSYNPQQIAQLMRISDRIAKLSFQHYQAFQARHNRSNAKPSLFAYQGHVYQSLDAKSLSLKALNYLQEHLLILSGLYGYLRPLDLIQPYRLEMKTRLQNTQGANLYAFWEELITAGINQALLQSQSQVIINLASLEYTKAIKLSALNAPMIHIHFQQERLGQYKNIRFYVKRARGLMLRFIAQNTLKQPNLLKTFHEDGYVFAPHLSHESKWVFVRYET